MSKGFILVKSYPFTFGYVMFYLPTLDPMDNVTGRAAPPAGGPWAGVPSDSNHDELGGVQPDRVQGLHGPLLDKFTGSLHSGESDCY